MTEQNRATDHEYDGIEEYDNNLPNWWLATLWLSIAFSIAYWAYYHAFAVGPDQAGYYAAEVAAAEAAKPKPAPGGAELGDADLLALAKDEVALAAGAKSYATNCLACHGAKLEGAIGPNLTDSAWLHGGSPSEIHFSIDKGWPEKGMMAWGALLGETKVRQLTAYLLSVKNSDVPGKAPEGEVLK